MINLFKKVFNQKNFLSGLVLFFTPTILSIRELFNTLLFVGAFLIITLLDLTGKTLPLELGSLLRLLIMISVALLL